MKSFLLALAKTIDSIIVSESMSHSIIKILQKTYKEKYDFNNIIKGQFLPLKRLYIDSYEKNLRVFTKFSKKFKMKIDK